MMNNIVRCVLLFLLLATVLIPKIEHVELPWGKTEQISVEVRGEVENPGIFTLPVYSTMNDLLELLVLTESADLDRINGQMTLKDLDVIIIPRYQESASTVSINYGTLEELCTVPHIGPVTAANIISYRESFGLFQSVDDLVKVKGIGPKTLEKIREHVSL